MSLVLRAERDCAYDSPDHLVPWGKSLARSCMWTTGTYLEQINKTQLQRYFVKRLQRLELKVTVEPAITTA